MYIFFKIISHTNSLQYDNIIECVMLCCDQTCLSYSHTLLTKLLLLLLIVITLTVDNIVYIIELSL